MYRARSVQFTLMNAHINVNVIATLLGQQSVAIPAGGLLHEEKNNEKRKKTDGYPQIFRRKRERGRHSQNEDMWMKEHYTEYADERLHECELYNPNRSTKYRKYKILRLIVFELWSDKSPLRYFYRFHRA